MPSSLRCPACSAHARYYTVICGLSDSTLSHKRHDFREKALEHKKCVLIFSTTFFWNMSHFKRRRARYDRKCVLVFMQCTVILVRLQWHLNILHRFSQNTQMSNLMKNLSKGKLVADSSSIRELPSERHSFRHSFPEGWLTDWLHW